jgi:hypothetical protein
MIISSLEMLEIYKIGELDGFTFMTLGSTRVRISRTMVTIPTPTWAATYPLESSPHIAYNAITSYSVLQKLTPIRRVTRLTPQKWQLVVSSSVLGDKNITV